MLGMIEKREIELYINEARRNIDDVNAFLSVFSIKLNYFA